MYKTHHYFHIPVMGTGFTLDSPLRVARFGISSVVSLVDDLVMERVRKHYAAQYGLPFEPLPFSTEDGRARRITAYLDLLHDIVALQMEKLRALPFEAGNEKHKYFELLPAASPWRKLYQRFLEMPEGAERSVLATQLSQAMVPGSIDCNIMTKLDKQNLDKAGNPLPMEFSDAKAALRGFARSKGRGSMVFSAGINPTLYGYIESFPEFYRDENGDVKKGIILKVSDYRSSLIQGKFLAKKGLEVREFRIESGLNCGGHAFASDGFLMGPILQEFKDNRDRFPEMFEPLIVKYFEKNGRAYHESGLQRRIWVTAQGGIGTHSENLRLLEHYGLDAVGWASPFLLVPEATALDNWTRQRLAEAGEKDLYLSDASPLGVAFNNLRESSAEQWGRKQIQAGNPGSGCPKKFLVSNTEFTDKPICTASKEYQKQKLTALGHAEVPPPESPDAAVQGIYAKSCICDQLGNGVLIQLGLANPNQPVAVCPGPNIAYFDRLYTLREMIDHIYGRGPSLVPASRPHLFAKDLGLSIDYFEKLVRKLGAGDDKAFGYLEVFRANLLDGLGYYRRFLSEELPVGDENFDSLHQALALQGQRLESLWLEASERMQKAACLAEARSFAAAPALQAGTLSSTRGA